MRHQSQLTKSNWSMAIMKAVVLRCDDRHVHEPMAGSAFNASVQYTGQLAKFVVVVICLNHQAEQSCLTVDGERGEQAGWKAGDAAAVC